MDKKHFTQKELKVELLSEKYKNILETFETDTDELKKFLVEDALNNQNIGISNTYLWFYKPDNRLVAYITILSDAIGIRGTVLGSFFQSKDIRYKTLPALKIGRLCVHKDYVKRGIGTYMIDFAIKKAIILSDNIGCRFISTDAKRNAIHFYKKYGFEILKAKDKGNINMFFDLIKQIRIRRKQ